MYSAPSSDCRPGSSLAAHRRASTGREVFIAPLAAHGKLQVPSCPPYEVRANLQDGEYESEHEESGSESEEDEEEEDE